MKKISFIQPSRNNLKYLQWSYNSIRKNLGYTHEICWADDFSNDGTWEWMQEIVKKDKNVKIHRNEGPKRLGHTILYDTLVNDYATNDIVMIYHADMYALPGLDEEASKLVLNYSKECPIKDIHPTLGTLNEVQVQDGITYWSGRGGVDWHSFVDYINSIEKPGIKFDKVVVDGRCRVFCAFKALDYLKDDGLLFIHDFMNRPWNHTVLEYYEIVESADTLAVLRRK